MTAARLTQQAAETLLTGAPTARVTQQAAEALLQPTPRARLTAQAVEILRSVADGAGATPRRPVMILCVSG
jgi:hypothetical protein